MRVIRSMTAASAIRKSSPFAQAKSLRSRCTSDGQSRTLQSPVALSTKTNERLVTFSRAHWSREMFMANDKAEERKGPDLKLGVPFESLAENSPLLGHFEGEAVIL